MRFYTAVAVAFASVGLVAAQDKCDAQKYVSPTVQFEEAVSISKKHASRVELDDKLFRKR